MLNRWVQMKKDEGLRPEEKRPFIASEVHEVGAAQRWRGQILKEISKLVSSIQNGSLGEYKIRDQNDQINKLLREKAHWERQIKALGGPDYQADRHSRITDADGKRPLGGANYFYFGAAKQLPGVRELFEQAAQTEASRGKSNRYDLYKQVDAAYYGFRDEEDTMLVRLEQQAEQAQRQRAREKWIKNQRELRQTRLEALGMAGDGTNAASAAAGVATAMDTDEVTINEAPSEAMLLTSADAAAAAIGATAATAPDIDEDDDGLSSSSSRSQRTGRMKSYVKGLPSDDQVQKSVLELRRAKLLEKHQVPMS